MRISGTLGHRCRYPKVYTLTPPRVLAHSAVERLKSIAPLLTCMERDDFEALFERLDELQGEAMERREENTGPSDEPTPRSMYFTGKDTGIAEAKAVIRERIEVEE